jgi:hypothetical protein
MVRGSSASKNLRLALCGGWLAALTACAASPPAPVFTVEQTAPRTNVSVSSETELRSRAERVFTRLVLANADVCRPFVVRQAGSRETSRWQCDQQLIVSNDNSVNAFATPNIVTVSIGMLRFLRGDDDLAFILAHEMSHNLIEQANWRQASFTPPKGSLKIDLVAMRGEPVRDILPEPPHGQEDEAAADYLGVYLAARAGFAMDKMTLLMRSLSALEPQSAPAADEAHPLIVWRYLAIDRAIREIAAKQTAGLPLIPARR